jgi:exopolysaccharide production negative regulator
MRIRNSRVVAVMAALAVMAPVAAGAVDAAPFASATEAYRQGISALKSGDTGTALPALEYAADRGVLGAQLKLARIYAAGNGTARDEAKAFAFYRQIANQRADISPSSPVARYVAEAFVSLGEYYLQGIPDARVPRNPARAAGLFSHAASYFGSADAQYDLALLYLDGSGVDKSPGLAVNWLAMAAKKQHVEAQAKLGELLWRGSNDIHPRQARGLALIMLAHANAAAAGDEPKWIARLYREVRDTANAATLKEARALVPELGGRAMVLEPETVESAPPAEKLLLPATEPAPASTSAPAHAADNVAAGEVSASNPSKLGAPLGFGAAPGGISPSN